MKCCSMRMSYDPFLQALELGDVLLLLQALELGDVLLPLQLSVTVLVL